MHMALELPATRARRSPHNPTQNGAGSGARARYSALSAQDASWTTMRVAGREEPAREDRRGRHVHGA